MYFLSFPFLQFDNNTDIKLKQLIDDLMIDLEKNAWLKQAFYKTTGSVEYKEYYPKLSKALIEDITEVICKEYSLNDAEIDFILNYDAKIRNGKSKEEEQE